MIRFLSRMNGSSEERLELSTETDPQQFSDALHVSERSLTCLVQQISFVILFLYCCLYSLIKQTVSTLLSLNSTCLYGGLWSVVVKFGCINQKLLNSSRIVLRGSAGQFRHHGTSLVTDRFLSNQVWVGLTDRVMCLCARWSHTSFPFPEPLKLNPVGTQKTITQTFVISTF